VDLQTRIHLCFEGDSAAVHFSFAVREFSKSTFREEQQLLGRSGPIAWPARSLGYSPLNVHLWRNLKSTVHATEVTELQGMHQRIQTIFEMIRTTAGIFQPVTQSRYRSVDAQGERRTFSLFVRRP